MLTSHCVALHLTGLQSSHCRRPSGSPRFYMHFWKVLLGKQHQVVNLLDDGWGNVFVMKVTSDKALANMPQHMRDLLQQSVRCSPLSGLSQPSLYKVAIPSAMQTSIHSKRYATRHATPCPVPGLSVHLFQLHCPLQAQFA
jgi:hypothetical protein